MITWVRTRTGTIHGFDMPFFLGGQEVSSLCQRAKVEAKPYFPEEKTREHTCRGCLKANAKRRATSGDIDI